MDITLEDLYFTTGSIAFTLISVVIVTIAIIMYRTARKIHEAQEKSKEMMRDALYTRYTIQAGILRFILSILGGDERK